MKTYVFKGGKREAENLTGVEIKECEKKLGKLISVSYNGKIVPVWYSNKGRKPKKDGNNDND